MCKTSTREWTVIENFPCNDVLSWEKEAPKAIEDDFDSDFSENLSTSTSGLNTKFPSKVSDNLCD